MKTFYFSRARWATLPLAVVAAGSSFAQEKSSLPPVVVTATRTPVPITDVLADVSVIDRDEIERSGASSLTEVLARLPGITANLNGGPASTANLYIRGAENRFTAVYIDGVRIDSQASGGASWNVIPLSQVDRVEVLRGPAAAIYGSDAVAGVVQIFTRQGAEGFFPSVSMGVGSHGTRQFGASLRGGENGVDYALSIGDERSQGFNATKGGNPDKDGYTNQSFSGRLGWAVAPRHRLEASFLDNRQNAAYDSSLTADDRAKSHLQTAGLSWIASWDSLWTSRFGITRGTDRYETSPSVYLTETRINTYYARNELKWGPGLLTADLERREDELQNAYTTPTTSNRHQNAVALGYGLTHERHSVQANARMDDDSEFGGHTTGSLAYGYALTPSLRATASTGTAFRVPTLFQRFSIYGTSSLQAETSHNREVGLRWTSGTDRASVVAYRNDVDNLIDYVSGAGTCINGSDPTYPGCYGNTGQARMTGVTFAGGTRVGTVNLSASLDVMDPKNVETDKMLARRSHTQSSLAADTVVAEWRVGTELHYVGSRYNDSENTTRLSGYTLINLTASRPITRDWRLLARIDNVTDKDYVQIQGYNTPGRTLFVGLSWVPR